MAEILAVGAGGFIGSVLRYLAGLIPLGGDFPIITFLINFVGSFIIGFIVSFSENVFKLNPKLMLFLKTGVCGGFTTFSTFSLETFTLFKDKKYLIGGLYALSSVIACVLGAALGFYAAGLIGGKANDNG